LDAAKWIPPWLCCKLDWLQRSEVGLIRRLPIKARMGPSGIVKGVDKSTNGGPCLRDTGVGPRCTSSYLMVRLQALDEDVDSPGAFPIHADLGLVLEQQAGEGDAGELGALSGVEALGLAISGKSLLDRRETEYTLPQTVSAASARAFADTNSCAVTW
jgi:hypothetical protein